MLETFSALLRIAQIEAGAQKSGFTEVDLSELVRSVGEAYQPAAEDSAAQARLPDRGRHPLTGDRQLLAQMISNLVENALRHTPAGSTVSLALRKGPASRSRSPTTDRAFRRPSATRCSTASIASTAAARPPAAALAWRW